MAEEKEFSRERARKVIEDEWQALLDECKLNPAPGALSKLSRTKGLAPELYIRGGFEITLASILKNFGETILGAERIRDQKQLDAVVSSIREARNRLPPQMRKALKQIMSALPRKGGPGRQSKLTPSEASQMCDQIAHFMRQGYKLKEALQKVSDLTPKLLGKSVGSRTLQKAWDRRKEFL